MKAAVLGGIPYLPGLVAVSFYYTNLVHFLSMCCKSIKWVQESRQLYDPKTQMVRDSHFLNLNVNGSFNYNMNSVELSDKLQSVGQFYHWMCRYNWCLSLLFWFCSLVLVNASIIYNILCE